MACSCTARNSASVPIFKSILNTHFQVLYLLTFSGIYFPDELSMDFLFMSVLFKLLCFLFFKFFTRYSISSIDCLSCSNSFNEVYFRFGNIKDRTILLFSNATFHTHQTSKTFFPLYVQSVHITLRV